MKAGVQTSREASDYHNEEGRKRASKGYSRGTSSVSKAYKEYRKKFWDKKRQLNFTYATHIGKDGKPVFPNSEGPIKIRPSTPWTRFPSPRVPTATKASTIREKIWTRHRCPMETRVGIPPGPRVEVRRPQTTSPRVRRGRKMYGKSYNGVLNKKMVPFVGSNSREKREPVVPGILVGVSEVLESKDNRLAKKAATTTVAIRPGTRLWKESPPSPIFVRHTKSSMLLKNRWSPRNTAGTSIRMSVPPSHPIQPSRQTTNW